VKYPKENIWKHGKRTKEKTMEKYEEIPNIPKWTSRGRFDWWNGESKENHNGKTKTTFSLASFGDEKWLRNCIVYLYTLSEAWSGVNWADLMAAQQGALVTDFYDRSILRPKHRAYLPVIKIGPKGALGSHEIRPIHSAPSLGQSIGRLHINSPTYPQN